MPGLFYIRELPQAADRDDLHGCNSRRRGGFVKLLRLRLSAGEQVPFPGPTYPSGGPLRARDSAHSPNRFLISWRYADAESRCRLGRKCWTIESSVANFAQEVMKGQWPWGVATFNLNTLEGGHHILFLSQYPQPGGGNSHDDRTGRIGARPSMGQGRSGASAHHDGAHNCRGRALSVGGATHHCGRAGRLRPVVPPAPSSRGG